MKSIHVSELVTEKGLILNNPEILRLKNHIVDILIIDRENTNKSNWNFAMFEKKWAGFIKNENKIIDRLEYLDKKHK
ncbi:MAG: hypothetical protein PHR06_02830 [Candidatus Cloacimonetes bacterium]|nr:hypothetical protein [Candidatus Cloacimonadota bacterium]